MKLGLRTRRCVICAIVKEHRSYLNLICRKTSPTFVSSVIFYAIR